MELVLKIKLKIMEWGYYIFIIFWLLYLKKINCLNLIFWLNIIFLRFFEMDVRGVCSCVIEFNGG